MNCVWNVSIENLNISENKMNEKSYRLPEPNRLRSIDLLYEAAHTSCASCHPFEAADGPLCSGEEGCFGTQRECEMTRLARVHPRYIDDQQDWRYYDGGKRHIGSHTCVVIPFSANGAKQEVMYYQYNIERTRHSLSNPWVDRGIRSEWAGNRFVLTGLLTVSGGVADGCSRWVRQESRERKSN
jgi:hypothetical protein